LGLSFAASKGMALPEEQDEIGKLQRILERKLIMPAPQPPPEPVGQARLGGGAVNGRWGVRYGRFRLAGARQLCWRRPERACRQGGRVLRLVRLILARAILKPPKKSAARHLVVANRRITQAEKLDAAK
jgi:hypothetical protein